MIPERVLKNKIQMEIFSKEITAIYSVKYIYKIAADEDFLMNPNMRNFQKLEKGEHIGQNQYGPIYAPKKGYLLMPLYQKQGKEGFYVINK